MCPEFADAHSNLGNVLKVRIKQNRYTEIHRGKCPLELLPGVRSTCKDVPQTRNKEYARREHAASDTVERRRRLS